MMTAMKIALGLVTGIVLLAGQNTGTPSSHGEDILSWVQWPAPMACPPQQQHAGASRWFAPTIMRHCGAGGIGSPGGRTAAPVRSVVNRALRRWRSRSRRRFGVIRTTVRNRVDNQLFRPRVANRRRRRFGRLRARFSEPDHAARRSLASRLARWSDAYSTATTACWCERLWAPWSATGS